MLFRSVQQVALKYLVRNNRTVGIFEPLTASERISVPERPNLQGMLSDYTGRKPTSQGEQFDPSPKNIESRLVKGKLKTGVPFAMLPKKTKGETVSLTLNLRFGDEDSLRGKSTAVEALGSALRMGTEKLDEQELNDRLDELNANVAIQSARQSLNISIETKRDKLIDALDVIRQILREPSFPADKFELYKEQALSELDSQLQDPQALARLVVLRALNSYDRGDIRYESTIEEHIEDMKALKLDDVKALHANFLSGSEGEVAVVGDFDPAEVEEKLNAMLANWKSSTPYQRAAVAPNVGLKTPIKTVQTPDKANSVYFASQQYAQIGRAHV